MYPEYGQEKSRCNPLGRYFHVLPSYGFGPLFRTGCGVKRKELATCGV
jgi:hypothetical protein